MSVAFGILFVLGTLLLNVAAKVLADDARTGIPKIATKIIVWAARRLPPEHQARWAEEWLAALGEMDERSRMLWHALGCVYAIRELRAELGASWKFNVVRDRVCALILLILVAPTMATIAFAIQFDSFGPVFYRQPNFGVGGQIVLLTKFRTMRPAADTSIGGPGRDIDLTRVGRFLHRTSLEELPHLWDVLRGRMRLCRW